MAYDINRIARSERWTPYEEASKRTMARLLLTAVSPLLLKQFYSFIGKRL
jgi:hypothetical protein